MTVRSSWGRAVGAAAVLVSASLAVAAPPAAGAAGATTAAPPAPVVAGWSTLQAQAVAAIASFDGAGPVTASALGPVSTEAPLAVGGRSVTVSEAPFVATDASGSYRTTMALLGGTQLLLTLVPTAGADATELELTPGTSVVAGVAHSRVTHQAVEAGPGSLQPLTTTTTLAVGSCEAYIVSPGTEESIYGLLVWGSGGFVVSGCAEPSAALDLDLQYWNGSTGVSLDDTAGASGDPSVSPGVSTTAFYPCTGTGPAWFQTAGLYTATGQGYVPGWSNWESLGCDS